MNPTNSCDSPGSLGRQSQIDAQGVLNALPEPVIVVDSDMRIRFVNFEAQSFFDASEGMLIGQRLADWLPEDSPLFNLIRQSLMQARSLSEYGVILETPRIGRHEVTITVGPVGEPSDMAVVTLHIASIARRIDNQLSHRNAARSVTGMASILAHEVKNPLSGIKGAAQLLEATVDTADQELTRLICDETDRIVAMVNRMEVFSDRRPVERAAVNIHAVLERVRKVAQTGFAPRIRFQERYDPSLPPVLGSHDQLVQVFLNLVKNAAEAAPQEGGEIVLSTAYQHGVSVAIPGSSNRVQLPLVVSVQDNGEEGIPEDLQQHLFDPFVSTKVRGSGLGLALVAKIVGDHGGVIELDAGVRRTTFKVFLPMFREADRRPQFGATGEKAE